MSTAAGPIEAIADALAESPVYVDPTLANDVPADVADSLVTAIEDNDLPVYVVAYPLDYTDAYNGRPSQLLALVQEQTGLDGVYVHTDADNRLETYSVGTPDEWEAAAVAQDEQSPAADLEKFLELVISGEGPALLDEQMYGSESESGGESGGGAGVVIGVVVAVIVLALIVAGVIVNSRAKRPNKAVRRAYDVPDAVVEAVRKSQESTVAGQARERVLALGEALDRTKVPANADGVTEYRAALDAYDAAGRTLDASDDPHLADAVGALVLTETGQAHLERATGPARDRRREMGRPCFFNPLHGAASTRATLPGGTATRVPSCDACARATKGGKQPQALMVTVDGKSMPYYESDLQPWADTGYGSIETDLVERVLTRGIER